MIRNNKWKLTLASLLILLPIPAGILLWDRFSWNLEWKLVFMLFPPIVLLLLFWIGVLWTAWDHKDKEQDKRILDLSFFMIPVISLTVHGFIYAMGLGMEFNPIHLVGLLLAALFLVMGNYMPKCRPNRTIGIKTLHTLSNQENWAATHRFCGRIWVGAGLLTLVAIFLPAKIQYFAMGGILLFAIVPVMIYPYAYAKKQIREGRATKADFSLAKGRASKKAQIVSAVILIVTLSLVGVMLFTGDVSVLYHDTSLEIEADYYGDMHLSYDAIRDVEYREDFKFGQRVAGWGSARLLMGNFRNNEFSSYTLYAYAGCDHAVILYVEGGRIVVLNGKDATATKAIYDSIASKIS